MEKPNYLDVCFFFEINLETCLDTGYHPNGCKFDGLVKMAWRLYPCPTHVTKQFTSSFVSLYILCSWDLGIDSLNF